MLKSYAFEQKYKKYQNFYLKIFSFWRWNISMYLNRHVLVMVCFHREIKKKFYFDTLIYLYFHNLSPSNVLKANIYPNIVVRNVDTSSTLWEIFLTSAHPQVEQNHTKDKPSLTVKYQISLQIISLLLYATIILQSSKFCMHSKCRSWIDYVEVYRLILFVAEWLW